MVDWIAKLRKRRYWSGGGVYENSKNRELQKIIELRAHFEIFWRERRDFLEKHY